MTRELILVLGDAREVGTLLQKHLKESYEVASFTVGIQALDWLSKGNVPSAIVLDLYMPDMDGVEFLKLVQERYSNHRIPVIILSSETSSIVKIQLLKAGAEDFISKPFNPEELYVRLEKILLKRAKIELI